MTCATVPGPGVQLRRVDRLPYQIKNNVGFFFNSPRTDKYTNNFYILEAQLPSSEYDED